MEVLKLGALRRWGVALPGWDTFAVIVGGAAGTLIGPLSVLVSIRIEVISAACIDLFLKVWAVLLAATGRPGASRDALTSRCNHCMLLSALSL